MSARATPMQPIPTIDRTKSIEELEACVWPHDPYPSSLVQKVQRLRKTPVAELSVEELRLLIGQQIGLYYLVPIAIEHLQINPLVAGGRYAGDLLISLLAIPDEYWANHSAENNAVVEMAIDLKQVHEQLSTEILPALDRFHFR